MVKAKSRDEVLADLKDNVAIDANEDTYNASRRFYQPNYAAYKFRQAQARVNKKLTALSCLAETDVLPLDAAQKAALAKVVTSGNQFVKALSELTDYAANRLPHSLFGAFSKCCGGIPADYIPQFTELLELMNKLLCPHPGVKGNREAVQSEDEKSITYAMAYDTVIAEEYNKTLRIFTDKVDHLKHEIQPGDAGKMLGSCFALTQALFAAAGVLMLVVALPPLLHLSALLAISKTAVPVVAMLGFVATVIPAVNLIQSRHFFTDWYAKTMEQFTKTIAADDTTDDLCAVQRKIPHFTIARA